MRQLTRLLSAILALASCNPTAGLNILVWSPMYGQSHVNFMGNIADTLHEAGHNVTMLLVENDRDVRGTGSKMVKIRRFTSPLVEPDEWNNLHFKKANIFQLRMFELGDYLKMEHVNYRICKSMLDDTAFLSELRTAHYDLAIVEMFHFCPAGIAHLTAIPKIVLASALGITMAHYEFTGLPITLSNTPAFLSDHSTSMSFPQRLFNVLYYAIQKSLYLRMYYSEQALFSRHFGTGFPDLYQLFRQKTDYILLNTNEFTDAVRPLTPNVKYIGGANIGEAMPLPEDLESIVSRPSNGTVLFSLGSIVKSGEMPLQIRQAFADAFASLPDYTFLWKDDIEGSSVDLPYNVHVRSWLPQVDLLADRRVKAFITHGGMNSIQEALYFGVPMVIMPIFADQDGNAALAVERGYAVKLSKFAVTKEAIVDALRSVLGEEGATKESPYTTKARQASRLLLDTPAQMRQEILRVARASGDEQSRLRHLIINSEMPFYQYYNLDVYLYLLLTLLVGLFIALSLMTVTVEFPSGSAPNSPKKV